MRFTFMESNSNEIRLENEEIDRISDLPDSILCKILSYLPTKHAIGVSILSTRWKNLYPFGFVPITLELDDSLLLNPRENNLDGSFMGFVDKLLNETLSDVPFVEKVILKCQKNCGDAKVLSWVCAALRLNVRHFYLDFSPDESMKLFRRLNGCATLVTLRLSLECKLCNELRVPDNFSLPSLKTLDLAKLMIDDEFNDPIGLLIKGCPALEYLYLVECDLTHWYDVFIRSPLLKYLVIENCWEESLGALRIHAPNLEELIYNNCLATSYCVCNFDSLQTAQIDIGPGQQLLQYLEEVAEEEYIDDEELLYFDNVAMIVSRCSSTSSLHLSDRTIDALSLSSKVLPVFQNLNWLSLGCLQWDVLARLLWAAPNLEQLTIGEGFQKNGGGFAVFKYLLSIPPECLVIHVKRIEFWEFEGDEDEVKLVEYFLKNGEVLQNMILHCLPPDDISILTRLLMLPRQSNTCQIECRRK